MLTTNLFIGISSIFLLPSSIALPDVINIVGLFNPEDAKQETAFKYAIDRINSDRSVLPRSRLSAQIEKISSQDSFLASKKVCHLLRSGVAAIFGPQSAQTASHVQSICDTMEIPHLETRWDYRLKEELQSINIYPHPSALSKAYADLINALGWESLTIIYENNEGIVRLQEILKAHKPSAKITIKQLPRELDYRPLLQQIKNSGESHIVLDCQTEKINDILKQAQQIGIMSGYHSYLITSLDLHSVELDEFKYGGTNITALRLVDPNKVEVQRVIKDLVSEEQKQGKKLDVNSSDLITTETALIYDAVHLFAKALHDQDSSQRVDIKPLSCDAADTWPHGYSLINYAKTIEMSGLTGVIKFDNQGFRSNFELDIIELTKNGLSKIGSWNASEGVNFTRTYNEMMHQIVENLSNKTMVVTTILASPYCMRNTTDPTKLEGYSVDLIHEISQILGFNYEIKLVPDGRYGVFNPATQEWSGMIKELLEQRADLAVADLTITSEREQVVDFTTPFMSAGISILYKKPTVQPPTLFGFLAPLSLQVWVSIALAYIGVSSLLFVLAKLSPFERHNSQSCEENPKESENRITLNNALWFTSGSIMQQGSDVVPKAISTRMLAILWWFVALILISSYTANLAAFRTVERINESPISSVEDLAKQTKIQYGAVKGGSTAAFFKDSHFSTYQHIWSFMATRPSVFANSNMDGVERVRASKGAYAFFMESTTLEYITERECDLTQVGELLNTKAFGIALPRNSPYRWEINKAILKLQESGKLHILKNKWWKDRKDGRSCVADAARSVAYDLGIADLGGLFVVLLGGMVVVTVVAVCEFIFKKRTIV